MVDSSWRARKTAVRQIKWKIWQTPRSTKLQVVTGETEPRAIIAGHQLSLELGGMTMATQAAHTAIFELNRGS